ncbi:MAG: ABC transporter ATP-binding protein [Armatimonadota bacterium]
MLVVRDLEIVYHTRQGLVRAVDGVSFDVGDGEHFGLVGESGCGKTTLAKGLLRLLAPNASIARGEIFFRGRDLVTLDEEALRRLRWREIAMIPQSAMNALDPVYRVGDQMIEAILVHDRTSRQEAEDRVTAMFTSVGLDPRRVWDYPHQFSGGMRQRALIAMALLLNPSLIIADEPTTALDVIVKDQILEEIDRLQRRTRRSMILVTHDISVVSENCDRMAVMYAGRVMELAGVDELFSHPFHPYTMGLQNAFPTLAGDVRELVAIPGSPPSLLAVPSGCPFHPRCPFAADQCHEIEPPLIQVAAGHLSACHFPDHADEFRRRAADPSTWMPAEVAT